MNGGTFFTWLLIALSSFNTIIPLWLGVTVLLNAERRAWGIWLAGGSLVISGAFFIFHTALLEGSLFRLLPVIGLRWYIGWIPVIGLPFAWYVAMLWFAGFWESSSSQLRKTHRRWLALTAAFGLAVLALLLGASSTVRAGLSDLDFSRTPLLLGQPLVIIIYPAFIICCFFFSLRALGRLEPTGRVMGDLARQRARPWLVWTSAVLIGVSLLVGWALLWVVMRAGEPMIFLSDILTLDWFDLAISTLISLSVMMLGEAIVSYEIFTGKTLPRQGFRRHWKTAIALAIAYSAAFSLVLSMRLAPIYGLLISTVLIAFLYALLNWRSYVERDRYLENLRPFIGSQQLYDRLIAGTTEGESSISLPFRALCSDVLGARLAYLLPVGTMATLAGAPLSYPEPPPESLPVPLLTDIDSPRTLCIPLDPQAHYGAVWGIPLWSERGLIGVLMLGEKLDGGLYTQEEMEIARASSERLIDIQAGAEMARRLMTLQRQRLAESQALDTQTRRVLHDDVLPQLHAVMLSLSAGNDGADETISLMTDLHRKISNLLRELPTPAAQAVERLGLLTALRQIIDGELRNGFDDVRWTVSPDAEAITPTLSPLAADTIYYAAREAIRNAARYGRGDEGHGALRLLVEIRARSGFEIAIEDDGVGMDRTRGSAKGTGQGLALHSTMMAVVGGSLSVESAPGRYTRVLLRLPIERGT
ncbi:MAG: hypothetical protein JWQ98_1744 [Chlorobi bacterium]|nr:hypothetical protein [Chlorobiota bacterium]